ncbi:hypothetical protein EB241_01840 [Erwinia psidii]|uniref:Uncharacterized protein n=1 Tax=Erwinia psidii TaxID=69224 RepID=A0A3N6SMF9_9GAMM|nr:hypothetical protein EB241_01840 [Erwinia psidii]
MIEMLQKQVVLVCFFCSDYCNLCQSKYPQWMTKVFCEGSRVPFFQLMQPFPSFCRFHLYSNIHLSGRNMPFRRVRNIMQADPCYLMKRTELLST